jgi:hypothetical protein
MNIASPTYSFKKPMVERTSSAICWRMENTMAAPTVDLDKFIELTPGVLGGKPRVAGHRIRVIDVAIWHEKLGLSADSIASKAPPKNNFSIW